MSALVFLHGSEFARIIHATGAGIALFLIGANIAFMSELGGQIVGWFRFKIAAVTLLLCYVAFSMAWASPDLPRLFLGFVAMVADAAAIIWMWRAIRGLRSRGVVGLVPIFRPRDE